MEQLLTGGRRRVVLALAREQQRLQAEFEEVQEAINEQARECAALFGWEVAGRYQLDVRPGDAVYLVALPAAPEPEEAEGDG